MSNPANLNVKAKIKRPKKYKDAQQYEAATAPKGCSKAIYKPPENLEYPYRRAEMYLKSRMDEIKASGCTLSVLTAGEKRVMDSYIIGKIAREGYSASNLLDFMQTEWQMTDGQSRAVLRRVLDGLTENNKLFAQRAKNIYIERLETIYRLAMERGNFATALKVLEQMAKAQGFWNDINIVAPVMNFKFGGTPEQGTITVMDTTAFTTHNDDAPATAGENIIAQAVEELDKSPF